MLWRGGRQVATAQKCQCQKCVLPVGLVEIAFLGGVSDYFLCFLLFLAGYHGSMLGWLVEFSGMCSNFH